MEGSCTEVLVAEGKMKLLTGCLVLAVLAGASGADAWPWSRNRHPRLPKPIDHPIVRPHQTAEKPSRSKHPSKYQRPEWGAEFKKTLDVKHAHEGNHSIFNPQ
jgi:hypothetical protein